MGPNLLATIRTHPGKTALEYADLTLRGTVSVLSELNTLLEQRKITSPHAKVDPKTGEQYRVYYPVYREPEIVESNESLLARIAQLESRIAELEGRR